LVALWPPIAVTCTATGPTAAPAGAVQTMLVGETVTTVAALPPKLTDTWPPAGGMKFVPVIATVVVPVTGPLVGLSPVTVGAGGAG
jgi:hypothetical protein